MFISSPIIKSYLIDSNQSVTICWSTNMNSLSGGNEASCKPRNIKTFVFFDTETTGLPSAENNKTKLTELSMIAVQADHISLGVFPRVQNKLTLCFNPRKMVSIGAEDLTGRRKYFISTILTFFLKNITIAFKK